MPDSRVISVPEHGSIEIGSDPGQLTEAESEQLLAIAQSRPGFCSRGYRRLHFGHYVGLVRTNARIIEILPKCGESEDAMQSRASLLRLLRSARRVRLHHAGSVGHSLTHGSLVDAFIHVFLDEVAVVVRRGLVRRYRAVEDDLAVVRSRIRVHRQVATNALRPDRIACAFDDFDFDHSANQLLATALDALRPWAAPNSRRWFELHSAFEDVGRIPDMRHVRAPQLDRQLGHYAAALDWALWLLRLLSPRLRAGSDEAPALLFDINRLFEEAVATTVAARLAPHGQEVVAQESRPFLHPVGDIAANVAQARPDLVVFEQSRPVLIADTKWTRVELDPAGRVVPKTAHAYQMLAYAALYGCREIALIYPWHAGLEGMRESAFRLPQLAFGTPMLRVHCVDVEVDGLPIVTSARRNSGPALTA